MARLRTPIPEADDGVGDLPEWILAGRVVSTWCPLEYAAAGSRPPTDYRDRGLLLTLAARRYAAEGQYAADHGLDRRDIGSRRPRF